MKLKELTKLTSSINVLYIEDDKNLRTQNCELFKNLFDNIDSADDGEEALQLYKKNNYELVITDINIPLINGIEVIKSMKKTNPTQAFLITTVFQKSEWEKELKELEIDDYLTKPLQTTTLLKTIEKIIKRQESKVSA